ncbi:hypothetical protein AVL59_11885 [Streptomyces griseochromogenes]|uniref:Uncharacterized protein n=1 Tax=Streptomyces griseochromogenes TaxID=68214 RepID=A0A1B1AUM1_9ACTN|nr:hypothetical protein AVL59_11885 [Streptomyces griseochromogenes]
MPCRTAEAETDRPRQHPVRPAADRPVLGRTAWLSAGPPAGRRHHDGGRTAAPTHAAVSTGAPPTTACAPDVIH